VIGHRATLGEGRRGNQVQIAFGALLTLNNGALSCFLPEKFPMRVRFAFCFNAANAPFGGPCRWWPPR